MLGYSNPGAACVIGLHLNNYLDCFVLGESTLTPSIIDCAIFIRSSATTIRFHDIDAFPQIPRLSEIEFYSTALTLRCIIVRLFFDWGFWKFMAVPVLVISCHII